MNLDVLKDTPPWDWPQDTGKKLLEILRDITSSQAERKLAAELAGDFTIVDDEIGSALVALVGSSGETDDMRNAAAIALGPALEHAYSSGFEDPNNILLSEKNFHDIQQILHKLYLGPDVPTSVRRSVLEVSVRAPQQWSRDAIRAAYTSPDEAWTLTAVFGMRFVSGFEDEILEALSSPNQDIRYHAVCAAGDWQIDAAWPSVEKILTTDKVDKDLLIAAIDAAVAIRPYDSVDLLNELTNVEDEDIADAAFEALAMVEGVAELDDDDDEYEFWR